jgi:SAM-dependent methyltransferase
MEQTEYASMAAAEDDMWWYRALHVRLLDKLAGVQGRVLDAGCGTGGFLAKLRRSRPELRPVGCDWAEAAVRWSVKKCDASVVRGSIDSLPFADGCFDAAVAADVLCHAAVDPPRALRELARVLRPGGRLVVNMPAFAWLQSAHDRRVHNARRVTARAMRSMLNDSGFVAVRVCYWNSLLLPMMVAHRKLRKGLSTNAQSDVEPFGPCLNSALYAITEIERFLHLAMPAGGSVLATALKPLD